MRPSQAIQGGFGPPKDVSRKIRAREKPTTTIPKRYSDELLVLRALIRRAPEVWKVKNRFVGHPWAEGRAPLFDLEMSRGDCVAYLKEQDIPHKVPRSACTFCPFKSNLEWRLLRDNDPAGWARAIEVDEELRRPRSVANRNLEQAIYLHRSCLPLVEVDLGEKDMSGGVAQGECDGMCGL